MNIAISQKAIEIEIAEEQIHAAMAKLSNDLTAAYKEASRFVPELVEKESDPRWFLSFHPNDPLAAAQRLANYWKKRKEIFQERTYLPINLTGHGALTDEDIRILKTGYVVNLPRDQKNRSVLYIDNSKKGSDMIPSLRVMFFFAQCVIENEMSRQNGFVIIRNVSNPFAANMVHENTACVQYLSTYCMPARPQNVHLFYISPPGLNFMPLFINTVFTWAVNYLGSYYGKCVVVHVATSKEDCLVKLVKYDLSQEGLPVGLGGSWTGGCEPWRKGNPDDDDALTLEIETDLHCLSRNALWLHNQAVAAGHDVPELIEEDCEMDASTKQQKASVSTQTASCLLPDEGPLTANTKAMEHKSIARPITVPATRRDEVEETRNGRCRSHTGCQSGAKVRVKHTIATTTDTDKQHVEYVEDKKARRRRMHTEAERLRRAKEKIEFEVLQEQVSTMTKMKQSLKEEQRRLEGLVQASIAMTTRENILL